MNGMHQDGSLVRRYFAYNIATWLLLTVLWIVMVLVERTGNSPSWGKSAYVTSLVLGPFLFALAAGLALRNSNKKLIVILLSIMSVFLGALEMLVGIAMVWCLKIAIGGGPS